MKNYVTREEWEKSEKSNNELLSEIKADLKQVLAWQNQFKGGMKLLVGLVTFLGAVGTAAKLLWPKSSGG